MSALVSYELGASYKLDAKFTAGLVWKDTNSIEGVRMYVRNEKTGEYVRIYEVGPDQWVDGQPQSWSRGNFGSVKTAREFGSKAYRYINRRNAK